MIKEDYRIRVWDNNAISIDTDKSSCYAEITEQGVLNVNSFQCEYIDDSTQYKVIRDKMCKLSEFILKP